jgi:predicted kinase
MLIILTGLPGVGKTAIARELARQIGAIHLRIDSIEQAMRNSGKVSQSLDDAGYRVAYALAYDNLRLGHTVIADSVNPIKLTRDAWLGVAEGAGVTPAEVEVMCSDVDEHRKRVESRVSDIANLKLPTWKEVVGRGYEPWEREHIVIDTAGRTVEECVQALRSRVSHTAK